MFVNRYCNKEKRFRVSRTRRISAQVCEKSDDRRARQRRNDGSTKRRHKLTVKSLSALFLIIGESEKSTKGVYISENRIRAGIIRYCAGTTRNRFRKRSGGRSDSNNNNKTEIIIFCIVRDPCYTCGYMCDCVCVSVCVCECVGLGACVFLCM